MELMSIEYKSINNEIIVLGIIKKSILNKAMDFFLHNNSEEFYKNITVSEVTEEDAIGLLEFQTSLTFNETVTIFIDDRHNTISDIIDELKYLPQDSKFTLYSDEIVIYKSEQVHMGSFKFFKARLNQSPFVKVFNDVVSNEEKRFSRIKQCSSIKTLSIEDLKILKNSMSEQEFKQLRDKLNEL